MTAVVEPTGVGARVPDLVRAHVARSIPAGRRVPATVRVRQTGEMQQRPGGRMMPFRATEDLAVDRVSFVWRARFPVLGPLALNVVDEFAGGRGRLRLSLLGIPLKTMEGPEADVGEAMRYLSELAWAPQALTANRELAWREVDQSTVEVRSPGAIVELSFDAAGDIVAAAGTRPRTVGKAFVLTPWAGRFSDYASFDGTRIPTRGEVWWELPEGRFTYWRARVTSLDLIG